MPRTLGDIPVGFNNAFPPPGKYLCRCIEAKSWTSPNNTPSARLTFITQDGAYQFDDLIWVNGKKANVQRLSLVAQRLCQMEKTFVLPDDDAGAAKQIARYIVDSAEGKDILITIIEEPEEYFVREGPEMGQKKVIHRRRVAFGGYERPIEPQQPIALSSDDDNIPF